MSLPTDPIVWRGIERILIILASVFFAWLGFKLFRFGHENGKNTLDFKYDAVHLAFSGIGPGLMFMVVGGIALVLALVHGGGTLESEQNAGFQKSKISNYSDTTAEQRKADPVQEGEVHSKKTEKLEK